MSRRAPTKEVGCDIPVQVRVYDSSLVYSYEYKRSVQRDLSDSCTFI